MGGNGCRSSKKVLFYNGFGQRCFAENEKLLGSTQLFLAKINGVKMNFDAKIKDRVALKIWNNYFKKADQLLKPLDSENKIDILSELKGHLFEKITAEGNDITPEKMIDAIEAIGEPEEFLKPLIADKLLLDAANSLNPKRVWLSLVYNLKVSAKKATISGVFFIGYLLIIVFLAMVLSKLFIPDNVGLFISENRGIQFGIISDIEGFTEILGYWIIPIAVIISVILYVVLTKLMKVIKET